MQNNEQQKQDQYHIWHLIARKLSGNASQKELQDLQELLLDNPHIQYSIEVLTDLWKTTQGQTALAQSEARQN
jgi:hypothetical protein